MRLTYSHPLLLYHEAELDASDDLQCFIDGHCNLDQAAAVSMLGVATVGWREAGRVDRIGARAEGGRQGRRARVLACRGCRDRGQEGTKRGTKKPGTSKEHPRNMLATSLQLWG
jgi:hypothetical protein